MAILAISQLNMINGVINLSNQAHYNQFLAQVLNQIVISESEQKSSIRLCYLNLTSSVWIFVPQASHQISIW